MIWVRALVDRFRNKFKQPTTKIDIFPLLISRVYSKERIFVFFANKRFFSLFFLYSTDLRIREKESKIRVNFCRLPFAVKEVVLNLSNCQCFCAILYSLFPLVSTY